MPSSLIVLGGGAIGVELAQVFARFGARVTVVEALGQLVPLEEPEAGDLLAAVFRAQGIGVRTGVAAARISHGDDGFRVTLDGGEVLTGAELLVATGRRANLAEIGAGAVGIDEQARAIAVDDRMRAAPGVWAIGDIVGHGAFTHMSVYSRGHRDRRHPRPGASRRRVPRGAAGDLHRSGDRLGGPDRGAGSRAGHGGQDRIGAGPRVRAGLDSQGRQRRPDQAGRGRGNSGSLVGATSAGPMGGEVLSMLTLAVHARVPVQRLREMIYAYPTFHRGVEDALRDLG